MVSTNKQIVSEVVKVATELGKLSSIMITFKIQSQFLLRPHAKFRCRANSSVASRWNTKGNLCSDTMNTKMNANNYDGCPTAEDSEAVRSCWSTCILSYNLLQNFGHLTFSCSATMKGAITQLHLWLDELSHMHVYSSCTSLRAAQQSLPNPNQANCGPLHEHFFLGVMQQCHQHLKLKINWNIGHNHVQGGEQCYLRRKQTASSLNMKAKEPRTAFNNCSQQKLSIRPHTKLIFKSECKQKSTSSPNFSV